MRLPSRPSPATASWELVSWCERAFALEASRFPGRLSKLLAALFIFSALALEEARAQENHARPLTWRPLIGFTTTLRRIAISDLLISRGDSLLLGSGRCELQVLIRHHAGERVRSVLHEPSPADEDARREHRELQRLMHERIAHTNRIGSLLVLHNLRPGIVIGGRDWPGWWSAHRELAPTLLHTRDASGTRVMVIVAELKRFEEARFGSRAVIKHLPEMPLNVEADLMLPLQRSTGRNLTHTESALCSPASSLCGFG